MLLEMDGFQVKVFPDIQGARQAANGGVDAFVIDCNLSSSDDGIELLKAIRAGSTGFTPGIPIIMTSGDDRRLQEAEAAGATDFLLKPYSPSALSKELSSLLA
jgi:CheY-like chemotaxis protein